MPTLTYADINKRCLAQFIGRGNFHRPSASVAAGVNLAQKRCLIIRPDNGRTAHTCVGLHIDFSGIIDKSFLAWAQR